MERRILEEYGKVKATVPPTAPPTPSPMAVEDSAPKASE
jgi:hypothetical protein